MSIAPGDAAFASPDHDLVCCSHLRWDFVRQRPQHLMERFAARRRVFFVEEAIPAAHHLPHLEFHAFPGATVTAVRPRPAGPARPGGGRGGARRAHGADGRWLT